MHTTLTTTPGRHDHHQPIRPQLQVRRVGTIDRLALRVGIALIAWGRRPRPLMTRERRATIVEQQLARLERERAYERVLHLTQHPR